MRNPGQVTPDHNAILATVSRSAAMRVADLVPATVVRLDGVAQPGPGGLLRAPVSGRPCVWFRVLEARFHRFSSITPQLPPVVTSDMGYPAMTTSGAESDAPFEVVDASGRVLLDPRRADIDAPIVSADTTTSDYGSAPTVLIREWILEAGSPVFVCGPVQPGPVLRATATDCLVVSGRGEAAARQRSQTVVATLGPRAGGTLSSRTLVIAAVAPVVLIAVLVAIVLIAR